MTGATASRGRPRDPALDSAILTAALELFVTHGITGMSIEQVAKRAGVGKPTIYRRWSTKELLVADAIEADLPKLLACGEGNTLDSLGLAGVQLAPGGLGRHGTGHMSGR